MHSAMTNCKKCHFYTLSQSKDVFTEVAEQIFICCHPDSHLFLNEVAEQNCEYWAERKTK